MWVGWNSTEFLLIPIIAFPYLSLWWEFGAAGAFFGGGIMTTCGAIAAFWRSRYLATHARPSRRNDMNLEPVWPALFGVILTFVGALQIILSVSHLSYYRTKDWDLF
eukprot:PhM_4_TR6533/c0_g1_i1/m.36216